MASAGRPSIYTPELATKICARLAEGESLRSICEESSMPAKSTVLLWVAENREGFSDQYATARLAQALTWAEEILEIADEKNADVEVTEDGVAMTRGEVVARSRLRVDTRKWLLSKVLPKVYGDKIALTDPEGGPLAISVTRRVVPASNRLAKTAGTKGNGNGNGNGRHA